VADPSFHGAGVDLSFPYKESLGPSKTFLLPGFRLSVGKASWGTTASSKSLTPYHYPSGSFLSFLFFLLCFSFAPSGLFFFLALLARCYDFLVFCAWIRPENQVTPQFVPPPTPSKRFPRTRYDVLPPSADLNCHVDRLDLCAWRTGL